VKKFALGKLKGSGGKSDTLREGSKGGGVWGEKGTRGSLNSPFQRLYIYIYIKVKAETYLLSAVYTFIQPP
jgi:hypothetical protein